MREDVADWLRRRSCSATGLPDPAVLLSAKGAQTVALVVPALDEASTVGVTIRGVLSHPGVHPLLDEVVVIDGGSSDATAEIAAAAGAQVVIAADIAPHFPANGKGGSVWRALQATSSDLVVVVDADLDPFDPWWVAALLAPLLLDPAVQLVKAASERPLAIDGILHPGSGGRVTEMLARPLLNALWPQLAGVAQPLSGEIAARRTLLEELPFAAGYGLEIGMLIDTLNLCGLDAIAQIDLGERRHAHQSDLALGRMASVVLRTALARADVGPLADALLQLGTDGAGERVMIDTAAPLLELPPICSLAPALR